MVAAALLVDDGPGVEKQPDHAVVSVGAGGVQRSPAAEALNVDLGANVRQELGHVEGIGVAGRQQRVAQDVHFDPKLDQKNREVRL